MRAAVKTERGSTRANRPVGGTNSLRARDDQSIPELPRQRQQPEARPQRPHHEAHHEEIVPVAHLVVVHVGEAIVAQAVTGLEIHVGDEAESGG